MKVLDYKESTVLRKENGQTSRVAVIFSELASHGQLYDFLKTQGGLGEAITRFYAQQLIVAIHHIHNEGFVHKDLKLENLLLDKAFNIKVTDFGMATTIEGSDNSGFEKRLFGGSQGYMAPEIEHKVPFSGQVADLFAFGVILFTMYAGAPPFSRAHEDDPIYRLICTHRIEEFWAVHAVDRRRGFFSDSFKDLITNMLAFSPYMRPVLADVACHEWLLSPQVATRKEV